MHMKKLMLAVMGLAAVAGGSARAAGVAVDLQSARAVGMAGAVSAFVDDASAIYFNPAGIAQGQGLEFMIGASPIIPNFKVTPQIPGGANNNQISGVTNVIPPPFIYFTYGISDEWTVGIGVYSPYGLKVEWPDAWHPIGRTIITTADLKTYDISPTVAYKNGPFRIGVGLQMLRATVQLQKDIGPLGDPDTYAHANLGAGTWGWGGNIGIQYEAIEKTLQFSAFYRSQVKLNFDGNAAFTNVPPQYGSTLVDQPVSTSITLPNNVGFGVAWRPMPELVLDADFMYTSWQQFQAIAINFQNPALMYTQKALLAGVQRDLFAFDRKIVRQISCGDNGEVGQPYLENRFREIKPEIGVLPILGRGDGERAEALGGGICGHGPRGWLAEVKPGEFGMTF